jgi:hypothetical protein
MLFWGRFSKFNSKDVILERFSGIRNGQNSFFTLNSKSVIWGIQEFQLTVNKKNVIIGEIRASYLFNHGNYEGEYCGTYSKICRFGEVWGVTIVIRNLDSKQKNIILET